MSLANKSSKKVHFLSTSLIIAHCLYIKKVLLVLLVNAASVASMAMFTPLLMNGQMVNFPYITVPTLWVTPSNWASCEKKV